MGLKLDQVVPWGRSLDEYVRMFALDNRNLQCSILDCGGGPASFNAELTSQGGKVVSCDPIYQFSPTEISQRIQATYPVVMQGVEANLNSYIWREISSPLVLGQVRMAAMELFLADFSLAQLERYVVGELPTLPFADDQFDLALCSHLLFTYSDHFALEFHLAALRELCRVAQEVRIFPLLNISGELSPHLEVVMQALAEEGFRLEIQAVAYEFQRGGYEMLRLWV